MTDKERLIYLNALVKSLEKRIERLEELTKEMKPWEEEK